jgi:hypothetical protein
LFTENQLHRDQSPWKADEQIIPETPQFVVKSRVDQLECQVRQVGVLLLEKGTDRGLGEDNLWFGPRHETRLWGIECDGQNLGARRCPITTLGSVKVEKQILNCQ